MYSGGGGGGDRGGYYGLVIVTPPPRPHTFHRLRDNLKNLIGLLPYFICILV